MDRKKTRLSLSALAEYAAIACFLAAIVVPGVAMLFQKSEPVSPQESAKTSLPAPLLAYERFKYEFEHTFGFRTDLVNYHARIKTDWLGVSPSGRVAFGTNGWLFYTDNNEIPCSRHALFNSAQLKQWAKVVSRRRSFLNKRGIHYLFVIAPDKHTIYPEHLPRMLRPATSESRVDQLAGYLKVHAGVDVLDLRQALLQLKKHGPTYYRTDTHWNPRGAFEAYRQIMSRVSRWYPRITPLTLNDCTIAKESRYGDLASFTALRDGMTESAECLDLRRSTTRFLLASGGTAKSPRMRVDRLLSENDLAPGPKIVMFRDSFASALLPFLAEHFRHAVYLWSGFDPVVVEKEHPDLVIEEVVERNLMQEPPSR